MSHLLASLLAAGALLPGAAWSFQPLVTDDTGTQGAGGNQIESSYSGSVEKEPGSTAHTRAFPFVYTRGLSDALDVSVGIAHARFRVTAPAGSGNGAGNALAGLKWRFYENESAKLSLAFKPEIRFAVSRDAENRGLGHGKPNAGAALLLTAETGFGAIHANLAVETYRYALPANRDYHRNALWRLSVAPVFELGTGWQIALDTGAVTNPHRPEKAVIGYVELGAIYSPAKDLDLAIGIIRDVRHRGHSVHGATAGITWRFR